MTKIVLLDKSLIEKIAAGEVVERPLSIIKELTENSVDAGATSITVEIIDGGLTQIRVTDNGHGISESDLPLAFTRHATSKIKSFDDLVNVSTMGFRGEALSSISAVSQVELITKTADKLTGVRVEISGGEVVSTSEAATVTGTSIIVSNLFYNVPARRKFLKKPSVEGSLITSYLERFALGNPEISIRYINNSKQVFFLGQRGDLKSVLHGIYGREVAQNLISVDFKLGAFSLKGFLGKPEIARGNRSHGTLFINSRLIQNKTITDAIESGLTGFLMQGKFPLYVLNLIMPYDALDVNVHPNKMDVRFSDENEIFSFVQSAIKEVMESTNLIPKVRVFNPVLKNESVQESFSVPEINSDTSEDVPDTKDVFYPERNNITLTAASPGKKYTPTYEENIPKQKPKIFQDFFTVQSLIWDTYWIVTSGDFMYLIDQHAAHERVLYERLVKDADEMRLNSQQLLVPIEFNLTQSERDIVTENIEVFERFGFEIILENKKVKISALPFLFKGTLDASFFTEILDKLSHVGFDADNIYKHKTELIAMTSCKKAVKGGDRLDISEAKKLIEELNSLDNPFTCPHGRPTIINFTRQEIESRFKR